MKSLPSFLVILAVCVLSFPLAAQNLVPNPSFENNTGCPFTGGQINLAVPWISPSTATPDYLNACSTISGLSTPGNFAGTETPLTGQAYAGMILYGPLISNYREYLQVQLSAPLVAGRCYEVSFNVSLAEDSDFAVDNLGLIYRLPLPVHPAPVYWSERPKSFQTGSSVQPMDG
ncbi:MAG: hypothetical protein KDC44_00575 [Phaeodactylibacter sp.]|nr:hypothetical protein [Phaeodactylibacter sp.]